MNQWALGKWQKETESKGLKTHKKKQKNNLTWGVVPRERQRGGKTTWAKSVSKEEQWGGSHLGD